MTHVEDAKAALTSERAPVPRRLRVAEVLALVALAFVQLAARSRAGDLAAAGAQAALVGSLVMAITLGEVLLDTPVAIAVGFALGQLLRPPPGGVPDA